MKIACKTILIFQAGASRVTLIPISVIVGLAPPAVTAYISRAPA
jgi:hypothetical protein